MTRIRSRISIPQKQCPRVRVRSRPPAAPGSRPRGLTGVRPGGLAGHRPAWRPETKLRQSQDLLLLRGGFPDRLHLRGLPEKVLCKPPGETPATYPAQPPHATAR